MRNWFNWNPFIVIIIATAFFLGVYAQHITDRPFLNKHITAQTLSSSEIESETADTETSGKVVFTDLECVKTYRNSTTKAYMDISSITDKTSSQWSFLSKLDCIDIVENKDGEEILSINSRDGYVVDDEGYIGVALGSYFGDIGNRYLMELSSGNIIKVVKVEEKSDLHTDDKHFQHQNNGGVVEFVIDSKKMEHNIADNGYVYSGNFNNNLDFKGNVTNIWKVV